MIQELGHLHWCGGSGGSSRLPTLTWPAPSVIAAIWRVSQKTADPSASSLSLPFHYSSYQIHFKKSFLKRRIWSVAHCVYTKQAVLKFLMVSSAAKDVSSALPFHLQSVSDHRKLRLVHASRIPETQTL